MSGCVVDFILYNEDTFSGTKLYVINFTLGKFVLCKLILILLASITEFGLVVGE